MSEFMTYVPTDQFDNTNGLYGNHFRFVLEAFPDLTYYVQSVTVPGVTATSIPRNNPFIVINEVPDHLTHGHIDVSFLIDSKFKNYSSLIWWMNGLGFPHSYEEIAEFRKTREKRLAIPRPLVRDLEKTNAFLYILQPDTDTVVVEFHFNDVFPTAIGALEFTTTDSDAPLMKSMVTLQCTTFDVIPAV